jgi:lysozyme
MSLSLTNLNALKNLLIEHEGYRNFPYLDTEGNLTIGVGYNLISRGLPDSWISKQLEDDIQYFYNKLTEDYSWFRSLNEVRQIVLVDMCFMGYKKFQSFKKMLIFLANFDYAGAAEEMLDSKWASQVGERSTNLSYMMLKGDF